MIAKPPKIDNKVAIMTPEEAVALIPDGATVYLDGAATGMVEPTALFQALAKRYKGSQSPKDLVLHYINGVGDRDPDSDRGYSALAIPGMVKKMYGGHLGQAPKLARMSDRKEVEAYNLPMGVMAQLLRAAAAHQPGIITSIGLHTFLDPRQKGAKLNDITKEDIVELMTIKGEEYLFYHTIYPDVAFLAASTSDEDGYITMEDEDLFLDQLSAAQAVHNNGGLVIVQVRRMVKAGSLHPKHVKIPGILVDVVVVVPDQAQSYSLEGKAMDRYMSGDLKAPSVNFRPEPLTERKVIVRRGLMEAKQGDIANIGVGVSSGINLVAQEENVHKEFTLTGETGGIGVESGPPEGANFGLPRNQRAIIPMSNQFDFYDGGGLDIAFVSFAQVDKKGNVNVHWLDNAIMGTGGFPNITAYCKKIVFGGTMTSGGYRAEVGNGKLKVLKEGRFRKFLEDVDQITFNGALSVERGQKVFYVTDRCVFRLTAMGLELIEIAPGMEVERDILPLMDFAPIVHKDLKQMDTRFFIDAPMHIREEWLAKKN
jgi:acetate CoA-transferase